MAEMNIEQRKALLRIKLIVTKLVPNKEILNGFNVDFEKIEKDNGRILKINDNEVMVLFDNKDSLSIRLGNPSIFVQRNLYSEGCLERMVINIVGNSVYFKKVDAIEDYNKTLLKRVVVAKTYQDNELTYKRNFVSQTTFTLIPDSCYSKDTILQVAPNRTAYVSQVLTSDELSDRAPVIFRKCEDYKPELFDDMMQKEERAKQAFVPCEESEYKTFIEERTKMSK